MIDQGKKASLPRKGFASALLSFFLVLILYQPLFSREIREVIFVSDPWPPFTVGEERGGPAQGGISIDLCKEIFSRLGVAFSSRLHPWKRTMLYLKTGEADLTFPLVQTEERQAYIAFTDIVMTDNSRVWFPTRRNGSPIEWEEIADLEPYRIGIVSGYSHGIFDQAIKEGTLKTEPCLSYEEGIRKLLHSRMDILLGNEPEINRLIREMKADGTINRIITPES